VCGLTRSVFDRKAALSYLAAERYQEADDCIRRSPVADEASNYYVLFLSSLLRGDDEPGVCTTEKGDEITPD
jgi:hypothetical protein